MYVYLSVKLFGSTPNYPKVVNLPSSSQIKQNESLTQLSGFTFLSKVHGTLQYILFPYLNIQSKKY